MSSLNAIDIAALDWFLVALIASFVIGLALLRWGKTLPRKGDWLAAIAVLSILGASFAMCSWVVPNAPTVPLRSWIWPRFEAGAVLVGFFHDPLSLIMTCLAGWIVGLSVLNRGMLFGEVRVERLHAASAFGFLGVALAWHAQTAWLGFGGIMIAVFGGFIAQGIRWGDDGEANIAARFGGERAVAWIFTFLGAAALSGAGAKLVPGETFVDAPNSLAILGAWLMAFGLSLQFQPFPFLGWLSRPSEGVPAARAVYAQILPGIATFAVLIRFESALIHIGVFPVLGWLMAASSVLSALAGLLQKDWRRSLGFWISAALGLCVASLALAGPYPSLALLAGTMLGGAAFALIGGTGCDPKRAIWSRVALIAAACSGSGMIGFISCGGAVMSLQSSSGDPAVFAAMIFVHLFSALLAWKLAWMIPVSRKSESAHLGYNLIPLLLLLGSLGVFWVGTASGGVIPGEPDAVLESAMAYAFPLGSFGVSDFGIASWAHWVVFGIAMILAYVTQARSEDLWQRFAGSFPKTSGLIQSGYGIDSVTQRLIAGVGAVGHATYHWVDLKIWRDWFPSGLSALLMHSSRGCLAINARVSGALNRGIHRSMDVPAKLLQLIQSGDVQWYLFFAIGSGVVMLIHFLRFQ